MQNLVLLVGRGHQRKFSQLALNGLSDMKSERKICVGEVRRFKGKYCTRKYCGSLSRHASIAIASPSLYITVDVPSSAVPRWLSLGKPGALLIVLAWSLSDINGGRSLGLWLAFRPRLAGKKSIAWPGNGA